MQMRERQEVQAVLRQVSRKEGIHMRIIGSIITTLTLALALAAAAAEQPKPTTPGDKAKAAPSAKPVPAGTTEAELAVGTAEARVLAPITDINAAMLQAWMAGPQFVPCGFACPRCGEELQRNVKFVLATTPAMSLVRCAACDYATALY